MAANVARLENNQFKLWQKQRTPRENAKKIQKNLESHRKDVLKGNEGYRKTLIQKIKQMGKKGKKAINSSRRRKVVQGKKCNCSNLA